MRIQLLGEKAGTLKIENRKSRAGPLIVGGLIADVRLVEIRIAETASGEGRLEIQMKGQLCGRYSAEIVSDEEIQELARKGCIAVSSAPTQKSRVRFKLLTQSLSGCNCLSVDSPSSS